MKRDSKIILAVTVITLIIIITVIILNNTGKTVHVGDGDINDSIILNYSMLTLYEGDSEQIKIINYEENNEKKLKFKTNNSRVVSISDSGVVTALRSGETTVTVILDKLEAVCIVKVLPANAKIIKVKENNVTLNVGESYQIEFNKIEDVTDYKVVYETSDNTVAVVSDSGLITAISTGNTEVYVYTKHNKLVNDSIKVEVTINDEQATNEIDENKQDDSTDYSGTWGKELSYEDFDVSGFYDGGIKANNKIYTNFIDYGIDVEQTLVFFVTYDNEKTDADYKTYKTHRGIKIGSSRQELLKVYGEKYLKDELLENNAHVISQDGHTAVSNYSYMFSYVCADGKRKGFMIHFWIDKENDTVMWISYEKSVVKNE